MSGRQGVLSRDFTRLTMSEEMIHFIYSNKLSKVQEPAKLCFMENNSIFNVVFFTK